MRLVLILYTILFFKLVACSLSESQGLETSSQFPHRLQNKEAMTLHGTYAECILLFLLVFYALTIPLTKKLTECILKTFSFWTVPIYEVMLVGCLYAWYYTEGSKMNWTVMINQLKRLIVPVNILFGFVLVYQMYKIKTVYKKITFWEGFKWAMSYTFKLSLFDFFELFIKDDPTEITPPPSSRSKSSNDDDDDDSSSEERENVIESSFEALQDLHGLLSVASLRYELPLPSSKELLQDNLYIKTFSYFDPNFGYYRLVYNSANSKFYKITKNGFIIFDDGRVYDDVINGSEIERHYRWTWPHGFIQQKEEGDGPVEVFNACIPIIEKEEFNLIFDLSSRLWYKEMVGDHGKIYQWFQDGTVKIFNSQRILLIESKCWPFVLPDICDSNNDFIASKSMGELIYDHSIVYNPFKHPIDDKTYFDPFFGDYLLYYDDIALAWYKLSLDGTLLITMKGYVYDRSNRLVKKDHPWTWPSQLVRRYREDEVRSLYDLPTTDNVMNIIYDKRKKRWEKHIFVSELYNPMPVPQIPTRNGRGKDFIPSINLFLLPEPVISTSGLDLHNFNGLDLPSAPPGYSPRTQFQNLHKAIIGQNCRNSKYTSEMFSLYYDSETQAWCQVSSSGSRLYPTGYYFDADDNLIDGMAPWEWPLGFITEKETKHFVSHITYRDETFDGSQPFRLVFDLEDNLWCKIYDDGLKAYEDGTLKDIHGKLLTENFHPFQLPVHQIIDIKGRELVSLPDLDPSE